MLKHAYYRVRQVRLRITYNCCGVQLSVVRKKLNVVADGRRRKLSVVIDGTLEKGRRYSTFTSIEHALVATICP